MKDYLSELLGAPPNDTQTISVEHSKHIIKRNTMKSDCNWKKRIMLRLDDIMNKCTDHEKIK